MPTGTSTAVRTRPAAMSDPSQPRGYVRATPSPGSQRVSASGIGVRCGSSDALRRPGEDHVAFVTEVDPVEAEATGGQEARVVSLGPLSAADEDEHVEVLEGEVQSPIAI